MTTYQRGHVTVDEHFARFGTKSYAINKITSVDVRLNEKRKSGWLFFAIMGGFLLISGLGALVEDGNPVAIIVGGTLLVPAVFMYRNRISRSYQLMLATAAGEIQATTSEDEQAISELRDAIETRIAQSGT